MLACGADAPLARLERELQHGRHAALELLLRLTRISAEGGQHTRKRIPRAEAIAVAGAGSPAHGEQVLRYLSGRADPGIAARGGLRLIVISRERDETTDRETDFVDLIHETLVRARRGANGKLEGYWPTLYDYVEKHRDRDLYEVTFLEYNFYVWREQRTGRDLRYPMDAGWGRHRRPAINVNWDEAQAYVRWLSSETGIHVALPSEVEWEVWRQYSSVCGKPTLQPHVI